MRIAQDFGLPDAGAEFAKAKKLGRRTSVYDAAGGSRPAAPKKTVKGKVKGFTMSGGASTEDLKPETRPGELSPEATLRTAEEGLKPEFRLGGERTRTMEAQDTPGTIEYEMARYDEARFGRRTNGYGEDDDRRKYREALVRFQQERFDAGIKGMGTDIPKEIGDAQLERLGKRIKDGQVDEGDAAYERITKSAPSFQEIGGGLVDAALEGPGLISGLAGHAASSGLAETLGEDNPATKLVKGGTDLAVNALPGVWQATLSAALAKGAKEGLEKGSPAKFVETAVKSFVPFDAISKLRDPKADWADRTLAAAAIVLTAYGAGHMAKGAVKGFKAARAAKTATPEQVLSDPQATAEALAKVEAEHGPEVRQEVESVLTERQPQAPENPVTAQAEAPVTGPKEPWQMTRDEWLGAPREWEEQPRPMTLDEWRAANKRRTFLDDHGSFRYPHGISKAERARMTKRLAEKADDMAASAAEYKTLSETGNIPNVTEVRSIRVDGFDTENQIAAARVRHKRDVRKALSEGKPVPPEVLADYPDLAAKYATTSAEAPTSAKAVSEPSTIASEGQNNAVQEQSTAKVPVRQEAQGGEGVFYEDPGLPETAGESLPETPGQQGAKDRVPQKAQAGQGVDPPVTRIDREFSDQVLKEAGVTYDAGHVPWETVMNEARSKGLVEGIEDVAKDVTDGKRKQLDYAETAAAALKSHELLTGIKDAEAVMADAGASPEQVADAMALRDQLSARRADLHFALRKGRSETARTLAAGNMEVTGDLGSENIAAKAASVRDALPLDEAQKKQLAEFESRLRSAEKDVADAKATIDDLQKALNERQAPRAGKSFGSRNKAFTKDAYEAAKARRESGNRSMGTKKRGAVSIDAQDFADLVTIVGYHIEAGVREFGSLLVKAKEDFGDVDEATVAKAIGQAMDERKTTVSEEAKQKAAQTRDMQTEAGIRASDDPVKALVLKGLKTGWRDLETLKTVADQMFGPVDDATFFESARKAGEEFLGKPVESAKQYAARHAQELERVHARRWLQSLADDKAAKERSAGQAAWEAVSSELPGLAKNAAASLDVSFVGRQGVFYNIARPVTGLKSFARSIRPTLSQKAMDSMLAQKAMTKWYDLAVATKLIPEAGTKAGFGEEQFVDVSGPVSRAAGKIGAKIPEPVKRFGRAVNPFKMSERNFEAQSLELRLSHFARLMDAAERAGLGDDKGYAQATADVVGILTGRGKLGPNTQRASVALNKWMFSLRNVASRFQILYGRPLVEAYVAGKRAGVKAKDNPLLKSTAVDYAKVMAFGTGVGLLVSELNKKGVDVSFGTDPDDADFWKLRFGDEVYDVFGGLATAARFLARAGGKIGQAVRGEKQKWGSTGWDLLSDFAGNKLAPAPRALMDSTGAGIGGKDVPNLFQAVGGAFVPISAKSTSENAREGASAPENARLIGADFVGIGSQYRPKKSKTKKLGKKGLSAPSGSPALKGPF